MERSPSEWCMSTRCSISQWSMLHIVEHRAQHKVFHVGDETTVPFTPGATGLTYYGSNLRALVRYLVVGWHIPIKG